MPMTNIQLPTGILGPGAYIYPLTPNPGGAIIFVNSTGGVDTRGRLTIPGVSGTTSNSRNLQGPWNSPDFPLKSVFGTNGALSYCKAGRGDLVVVLPGHSENLASGAGVNVPANVAICGLGAGSTRPTFNFTNAASFINSNGAGVQISNCIFDLTQVASLTKGFQIQHSGWQILNSCRIIQASGTNQAATAISLLAGADDFLMFNSELDASAAAGATIGISNPTTNNINRPQLISCLIHGDWSTCPITYLSTSTSEIVIEGNTIKQQNATSHLVLSFPTGNTFTGTITNNDFYAAGAATVAGFISNGASTGLYWLQNFGYINKAGGPFSGILVPAAGTIP